jgi:hypothetical protein
MGDAVSAFAAQGAYRIPRIARNDPGNRGQLSSVGMGDECDLRGYQGARSLRYKAAFSSWARADGPGPERSRRRVIGALPNAVVGGSGRVGGSPGARGMAEEASGCGGAPDKERDGAWVGSKEALGRQGVRVNSEDVSGREGARANSAEEARGARPTLLT